MSMIGTAETDLLELYFTNAAHPNIGNTAGLQPAGAAGSFWISLLTADPEESGAVTNECVYTGYVRIAVARSGAGWTISGSNCSNAAAITFGEKTAAGDEDATHFGIHTAVSGAGNMIFYGALTATLSISDGVIPEFAIGDLDVNVD